jgi:hypothetical protein
LVNKTLTGTVFYNFASDSLDTKIDAQINYANYKMIATALRPTPTSHRIRMKCTQQDVKYQTPQI